MNSLEFKDDIAKKFGFSIDQLYLITDTICVENKTYLKIFNPFNGPVDIKS